MVGDVQSSFPNTTRNAPSPDVSSVGERYRQDVVVFLWKFPRTPTMLSPLLLWMTISGAPSQDLNGIGVKFCGREYLEDRGPAVNFAAFDVRRINGVQIISFALPTKPTLTATSQQRN
jgi:hypothetical protein